MYSKLQQDHRILRGITGELRNWIGEERCSDPAGLAQCRWKLARMVTAHLALEDAHVYGPLANDHRPEAVAILRRFRQDLGLLLGQFSAHIGTWSAEAVMADWQGYCREAGALLAALDRRIDCEDDELYPLLIRDRAIRAA